MRLWATYFGGANDEILYDALNTATPIYWESNNSIATDECGNVYFSFNTYSNDLPTVNPMCNSYYDDNLSIDRDCFIVKFTKSCQLKWATYLGGETNSDYGIAMTLNKKNDLFFASTIVNGFGYMMVQNSGSMYDNIANSTDSYIGIFRQPQFDAGVNFSNCGAGCTAQAAININTTCNSAFTYLWSTGATTSAQNNLCAISYQVTVTDTLNCTHDTVSFTIPASGISVFADVVQPYSCSFGCSGEAVVNIPGISNATYLWSNGSTASSVFSLCPGNYSVIVNVPGCGSSTSNFSIVFPPPLQILVNSTSNPVGCDPTCNEWATIVISGGATGANITWTNGDVGTTADSLCPGLTYYVTAVDSLCYTTNNYAVTIAPHSNMSLNMSPHVSCSCDGYISLFVNNPSGAGLTYLWSNAATNEDPSGLCPGTYTVTVTDAICGTISGSTTVVASSQLIISNINFNTSPCPTSCNATANPQFNSNQTTSPFTYQWSNGQNSSTATGLCIDSTYYVTVTDACGSSAMDSVTITNNSTPLHIDITPLVYTCPGTCNGVALPGVWGGLAPYSFVWSNGQLDSIAYNLCSGNVYGLTVTDGCGTVLMDSDTFPAASAVEINTGYSPSCPNACNGIGYGYIVGGVSPFNYLWSNGETATFISNLCVDSLYHITVTDACGTEDTGSVLIELAEPVEFFIDYYPAMCPGVCDGFVDIYYSGGTPPFIFQWSTGSQDSTGWDLCNGIYYGLTITDPGCTVDSFVFFTPVDSMSMPFIDYQINTSCAGACDGEAGVNLGSSGFDLEWSTGEYDTEIYGLSAGNYTVTVYGWCDDVILSVQITDPPQMSVSVDSIEELICGSNCDGSAQAFVTGGVPPYTYLWSNGETGAVANWLCGGINFVQVFSGCDTITGYFVVPALSNLTISESITEPLCHDSCNGALTLNYTGGVNPTNLYWNSGQTNNTLQQLCAGFYIATVTDSLNCQLIDTVQLTQPDLLSATVIQTNVSCNGLCDAVLVSSSTGGTSPFSVLWDNGSTADSISSLCPGNYCLTVHDAHQCVASSCYDVTEPAILITTLNVSDVNCYNACDGSIISNSTGGTLPYNFLWNDGSTNSQLFNICIGEFCLSVTDNHQCTFEICDSVFQPTQLLSTTDWSDATCFDLCNGDALTLASGGTFPYSFLWSNAQTNSAISSLCNGTYYVTTTDNNGCNLIDTIIISEPQPLQFISSIIHSHCSNDDGEISITVTGGTLPFNYQWSNGETSSLNQNLISGQYSVTVSDSNSCSLIESFIVIPQYPVVSAFSDTSILIGSTVNLSASGATNYFWIPDFHLSCDTCAYTLVSPTITTTYCAIGTDEFNCADTSCVEVFVSWDCGEVQVPNAFSPNGDGHNDVFRVLGKCISDVHMRIYNRWGQLVFESFDKNFGWNGTYLGADAEIDAYPFEIEAKNLVGQTFYRKGNVSLLR